MHRYHFGPLRLTSALQLPELCEIGAENPPPTIDVVVETGGSALNPRFAPTFTDKRAAYDLMVDRATGIATMRHEGAVDYEISAELDHVIVRAAPNVAQTTVRHYLLDQVLPRVLEAQGHFVLHASGIETAAGSVLFLGDSGSGKSSLAAEFERNGCRLLGDDCFVIDTAAPLNAVTAQSTYPSLRLLPDSIAELFGDSVGLSDVAEHRPKQRVDQDRQTPPRPGVVAAVFSIDLAKDHHGEPEVRSLAARHVVLQLVTNSFRFQSNSAAAERSLAEAEAIRERVPMYDLRYEREYAQLPQVIETVLAVPELEH